MGKMHAKIFWKWGTKMTPNEYQKLCMRTANELDRFKLIVNGAMGLCGEAGEVIDLIKKWVFQGHELYKEDVEEELGDALWYAAILCEGIGTNMEEVMQKNIDKLKKRYPNGFEAERSVNRGDAQEAGD